MPGRWTAIAEGLADLIGWDLRKTAKTVIKDDLSAEAHAAARGEAHGAAHGAEPKPAAPKPAAAKPDPVVAAQQRAAEARDAYEHVHGKGSWGTEGDQAGKAEMSAAVNARHGIKPPRSGIIGELTNWMNPKVATIVVAVGGLAYLGETVVSKGYGLVSGYFGMSTSKYQMQQSGVQAVGATQSVGGVPAGGPSAPPPAQTVPAQPPADTTPSAQQPPRQGRNVGALKNCNPDLPHVPIGAPQVIIPGTPTSKIACPAPQ